ncbi:MAG: hypothetical protein DHS20C14_07180 [Phycisphaeraceae bacterium]|nr:MAG: hypothetical protein DHS20C14_07180 [Phycisphaeraceae bacterium]
MRACALAVLATAGLAGSALAGPSDFASLVDASRTFNDRPTSNLSFGTDFGAGTVSIVEDTYGAGGFANRHIAWFGDSGGSGLDFNYGWSYDMTTKLQVNQADNVGQVEAGFQVDNFGLGFFGVLTGNGEIAAFGGYLQFHSFGTGVYNVGDEVLLRMIYSQGGGENDSPAGTMEYMYNNLTTASGWVSSGALAIGNLEGGIPSGGLGLHGVGAQINGADDTLGAVDVQFSMIQVTPTPASAALLGLGGLVAMRRRR